LTELYFDLFDKDSGKSKMAKKADRIIIHLACEQCKERTYTTTKNKRNDPGRLELNKYCPRCHGTKLHRETK
jgi:large subunit ribosomal protein L33